MELNERLDLCRAAIRNEHTDHFPIMSNFYTAMTIDSEYTYEQAFYDWDIMYKIVCEHVERYGFDYYADRGYRNPFAFVDALGANLYEIDRENQTLCLKKDTQYMNEDEYDELLSSGYFPFMWSKILAGRCELSHGDDVAERWKTTFAEYGKLNEFNVKMQKQMLEVYKRPNWFKGGFFPGVETLMMGFRGLKGFSIDLRRRYDKVKAFCDMMYNDSKEWTSYSFIDKTNDIAVADFMLSMLTHSLLNTKQFEDLWWAYVKDDIFKAAVEKMTVFNFVEASMLRFADFFKDIPNGCMAIFSENDDMHDIRKALPNVALVGGMPCNLMYNGTKAECVDHVKKVIDDFGDHGLTFSQDKMVAFKQDFNRENLLAMIEYIRSI